MRQQLLAPPLRRMSSSLIYCLSDRNNIDHANRAFIPTEASGDPITFKEAINGPKAAEWMGYMR